MIQSSATMEALRWGCVNVPGVLFTYAKELELDMEDIGILAAIIYAYGNSRPLFQTGIEVGQVLESCSALTRQKLSRKLSRLHNAGIINLNNDKKSFSEKEISLEPLIIKLESFIIRDHPHLSNHINFDKKKTEQIEKLESLVDEYKCKIEQLEVQLEDDKVQNRAMPVDFNKNDSYRRVADFVARKTGNLLSVKMSNELRVWLDEMAFSPEFLLVMLELCFERKISNPSDISKIARDLREYSIKSLDGLELYFKNYVDTGKNHALRVRRFDPDVAEFGNYTGIDMSAEARKRVYNKWRYDWGFSHAMIMKAGEVMCQRTKNGGLEYMDSVLNNWMYKEIRQVQEAEKEVREFKGKKRSEKKSGKTAAKNSKVLTEEYEIYVPPPVKK